MSDATTDRIIASESPRVGVLIGTYGSPCYVHLGLEMLRRHVGDVPVLVHDDASFETAPAEHEALKGVCRRYGADFSTNARSFGHMQGDFSVFLAGWDWAPRQPIDLLVKLSRRFVPVVNWLPELQRLAYVTQYATYSNGDACHALGFRTECLAMHVASWFEAGAVAEARRLMGHNQHWFVEAIVHNLARMTHRRNACRFNRLYEQVHPPVEPDLSYGMWPFMGGSRCVRMPGYLWRDCWTPAEYHARAVEAGIDDYPPESFARFKEH